jgi:hypothetical protein
VKLRHHTVRIILFNLCYTETNQGFNNSQDEKYNGVLDGMLNLLPLGDNPKRFIKVICKMIIKGLSMKYVSVEKVVSMGG